MTVLRQIIRTFTKWEQIASKWDTCAWLCGDAGPRRRIALISPTLFSASKIMWVILCESRRALFLPKKPETVKRFLSPCVPLERTPCQPICWVYGWIDHRTGLCALFALRHKSDTKHHLLLSRWLFWPPFKSLLSPLFVPSRRFPLDETRAQRASLPQSERGN